MLDARITLLNHYHPTATSAMHSHTTENATQAFRAASAVESNINNRTGHSSCLAQWPHSRCSECRRRRSGDHNHRHHHSQSRCCSHICSTFTAPTLPVASDLPVASILAIHGAFYGHFAYTQCKCDVSTCKWWWGYMSSCMCDTSLNITTESYSTFYSTMLL